MSALYLLTLECNEKLNYVNEETIFQKIPKMEDHTDPPWTGKVNSCYSKCCLTVLNPSHRVYCDWKLVADSVDKTILFWR